MNKKKNAVFIIVIIVSIIVLVGTGIYLGWKYFDDRASENNYENTASSYASGLDNQEETEVTAPEINAELAENPIDFDALTKKNSDIYSWIYIPDTNINYPVLQSGVDDNFYLDHGIDKNYRFAGAIYSQSCNSRDYSDRMTLLYGHNMADGSMFANLHKFRDKDFFDKHRYIYVYLPERKLTYEVVSAFVYDDRHIMNSFNFSEDDVFEEYLDMIKKPHSVSSNVENEIELSKDDKILTLSTCLNSGNGRYLVQGVLKKNEPTQ